MVQVVQAIAGSEFGGAETFFTRLCVGLKKAGIDQVVIARPAISNGETLSSAGIPAFSAQFGGALDFSTRRRMKQILRQFKPKIVVTWMNRATSYCPRADNKLSFIHVARLGGYYNLKYYKHCDYLVGNTLGITNWLNKNGWPIDRCKYLPNFVPIEEMTAVDRLSLNTPIDVPVILAGGRLHKNKAFDVLITAIEKLQNVHLWLAGEGPLKSELVQLSKRLGIVDRVHFLGWRLDMPALYASADLFVCSSQQEPLGNVVIEAWAYGVPVICTEAEGPKELVQSGKNGLLVPINNVTALVTAIKSLIDDKSMRLRFVKSGRHFYEISFTEKIVVDKFCKFFERIAG